MSHIGDRTPAGEVVVSCNEIDWEVVAAVDVTLDVDAGGWEQQGQLHFSRSRSDPQRWRPRLDDPSVEHFWFEPTYHLRDGRVHVGGRSAGRLAAGPVDVPHPFHPLEIEFLPLFDQGSYRMILVDVDYAEPACDRGQQERLTFPGTGFESQRVVLQRLDPNHRTFRYRTTFVGRDRSLLRGRFVTSDEPLVGLFGPAGVAGEVA